MTKKLVLFVFSFFLLGFVGCASAPQYLVTNSFCVDGVTVATVVDTYELTDYYKHYLQVQNGEIKRVRVTSKTFCEAKGLIEMAKTGNPKDVEALKEFLKGYILSPVKPEEIRKIKKEGSKL